jgi:hypothetical protein
MVHANDTPITTHDDEPLALHAEMVAHGVRMIAQAGHCRADEVGMLMAATEVERHGCPGAIPFVVNTGKGSAVYGYASHQWALDLYRWVVSVDAVPESARHSILGLLHGYSPDAIRSFHESVSGRRFTSSASPESAAT